MEHGAETPATLSDLRLPPAFVQDHCIRTLSYQGSMTVVDIARHWRVRDTVAAEVVDGLKASGIVRSEGGPTDFDRLGRVRLTETGQARVGAARERTWYAGPLPVSLANLARLADATACACSPEAVRSHLGALSVGRAAADEIGQAIVGGVTLVLNGAASDEQTAIAAALGRTLDGQAQIPYAVYAAGNVVRLFDPKYHRVDEPDTSGDGELAVLRSHAAERTQWLAISPPVVTVAGGVHAPDVLPAYDDEARFYLAPIPFTAWGGLLCVFDSDTDPLALADLARLWLIPGRHGSGIIMLRSGERIEVPWRASTVLFNAAPDSLPAALRDAVTYMVDISELPEDALEGFLASRLPDPRVFDPATVSAVANLLTRVGLTTRPAAARAAQYLQHRAAYEGGRFTLAPDVLQRAIDFAASASGVGATRLHAA